MKAAGEKERIAVIRSPKGKEERIEAWRFHSIVNVLRQNGSTRPEAESIAEWAARSAKPGTQVTTWTGYTVEIEEEENGNV